MKAIKSPYAPDTYSVTDSNGKFYTVRCGQITAHHNRHGRITYVDIDPAARPELAERIKAAIAAAPPALPAVPFRKAAPARTTL